MSMKERNGEEVQPYREMDYKPIIIITIVWEMTLNKGRFCSIN